MSSPRPLAVSVQRHHVSAAPSTTAGDAEADRLAGGVTGMVWPLHAITGVSISPQATKTNFVFHVEVADATIVFRAPTKESAQRWISVIRAQIDAYRSREARQLAGSSTTVSVASPTEYNAHEQTPIVLERYRAMTVAGSLGPCSDRDRAFVDREPSFNQALIPVIEAGAVMAYSDSKGITCVSLPAMERMGSVGAWSEGSGVQARVCEYEFGANLGSGGWSTHQPLRISSRHHHSQVSSPGTSPTSGYVSPRDARGYLSSLDGWAGCRDVGGDLSSCVSSSHSQAVSRSPSASAVFERTPRKSYGGGSNEPVYGPIASSTSDRLRLVPGVVAIDTSSRLPATDGAEISACVDGTVGVSNSIGEVPCSSVTLATHLNLRLCRTASTQCIRAPVRRHIFGGSASSGLQSPLSLLEDKGNGKGVPHPLSPILDSASERTDSDSG